MSVVRQRATGRVTAKGTPVRTVVAGGGRAPRRGISVLWQAPIFNFSGYGDEARALILSLSRLGYPITARPWGEESVLLLEQLARTAPERLVALHRATEEPVGNPFLSVLHAPGYAATRVAGAGANVARTMFETDGLPTDWVGKLNDMDEVWVPTSFNAATFRQAGVTAPIFVVPGGVDATSFRPGLRPLRVPGSRGTVFLSVFEWSFRKGWDVLLAAWADAFKADDDVSLLLRSAPANNVDRGEGPVSRRIEKHLEALGRSRRDVAPIVLIDQPLSAAELPRLYAAADVYVSSSRGEGWGRPMMEAMACRLPTIATRWSGNLEFMHDDNSMLIDVEGIVPVDHRAEFSFYGGQRWAEPSIAHLSDILRRMAAEPDLRRRLGAQARRDIEQRWQWKHAAATVIDRMDSLAAGLDLPAEGARLGHVTVGPKNGRVTHIRWEGDFYAHHSLAGVNRAVAGRLAATGTVHMSPVSREAPPFPPDTVAVVQGIMSAQPLQGRGSQPDVVVRHQWPPDLRPVSGRPVVLVQPWEFGGIPAAWVMPIARNVAEVWCPTSWVADCYVRSGVSETSVAVVPHGVDTDLFSPDGTAHTLRTTKSTKLLFVGGTIKRKGIDVLLRSYLDTFSAHDDVCLVVKAFGASHIYRGSTIDEQLRAVANDPSGPAVELIDEELTDAQMAALYRSCDALVHPYRGEGFGLPIAEAMATELPVVVTDYGACLDFCDQENALFVPSTLTSFEMADVGPSSIGYWWAEPDGEALGAILRQIVDDPAVIAGKGTAGRRRIVDHFTWDAVTEVARRRLVELSLHGRASGSAHG